MQLKVQRYYFLPVNLSRTSQTVYQGPVHTYPDIFENTSPYICIIKYPGPREERFREYPHLHENDMIFEIRKQTNKVPSGYPQRSKRMLLWLINRRCDVSGFEKLRFHPSPRQQETGVFKKIHSGERFGKASFSVAENAVSV